MGDQVEASATMPTTAYWVELDRHYRVTAACDGHATRVGRDVWWRGLQDVEDVVWPAWERAWRTGLATVTAMFNGRLWRLRATRHGNRLIVDGAVLEEIDVSTLAALEASLRRVADALSAHAASEAPRPVLRVV